MSSTPCSYRTAECVIAKGDVYGVPWYKADFRCVPRGQGGHLGGHRVQGGGLRCPIESTATNDGSTDPFLGQNR